MHANIKTAKLTEAGDISNARQTVQKYSSLISQNVSSEIEKKQYAAWNFGNAQLLQSPAVLQQEQIQQQQQTVGFPFAPQPQQQAGNTNSLFSFGAPQQQPANNNNSNSFFSFGAPPQPAPPQQQQSNSIFSGFNFPWPSSTSNTNQQSSVSPSPSFQSPQQQYDDMTSNQIYQQKDNRKNQKQWSKQRKY